MKIIESSVELVDDFDEATVLKKIERAGRVCYKSEGNIKDDSAEKFICNIIRRGHESVIEHATISFKIICDRGVTHELVRHRLASYCVTGDTIIPCYLSKKGKSAGKFNMRTIYEWYRNPKGRAAFQQLIVRSFDEQTHSVVSNKIRKVFFNGIKDVFELITENGRILKCTGGHKFFTDDGWKALAELEHGNFIYVSGASSNHHYLKNENELPVTGTYRDKILSINHIGREKVYDLEMEPPYQNYVANGIIVHNSQESTRYCDYSAGKFGNELTFIKPCFWEEDDENFKLWKATMSQLEKRYLELRAGGARPEEARSILPNSLKTEIFVTMNLREWRHFLRLRTAKAAHPQMREIAMKIYEILVKKLPAVFDDIQQ